jgi:hypothetical protein
VEKRKDLDGKRGRIKVEKIL